MKKLIKKHKKLSHAEIFIKASPNTKKKCKDKIKKKIEDIYQMKKKRTIFYLDQ